MTHYHVISDIHGCYAAFDGALQDWNQSDTLVLLGDYVDRGPDSKAVVDRVRELDQQPNVVVLRGNHDVAFARWVIDGDHQYYYQPGFKETLISYMGPKRFKKSTRRQRGEYMKYNHLSDMRWLAGRPKYHETDHMIFTHAGINLNIPDWRDDTRSMDIIREPFYRSSKQAEKTVVFGHTPTPFLHDNEDNLNIWESENLDKIGIDGGISMGGVLHAVRFANDGHIVGHKVYRN